MNIKIKPYYRLIIAGMVLMALLSTNHGKAADVSDQQLVELLLEEINSQHPGLKMKVDLKNCNVKPMGNSRFQVIFRDHTFSNEFLWLVDLIPRLFADKGTYAISDTCRVNETIIDYDFIKKEIRVGVMKGIRFEYEATAAPSTAVSGFRATKYHGSIGKIAIEDRDVGEKAAPGQEALQPFESRIENIKFGLTGITAKKDEVSISLEIEKMDDFKGNDTLSIGSYLFDKQALLPNIDRMLKKGTALEDYTFNVDNVKILIEKNGSRLGGGEIGSAYYSFYFKPNDARTGFKMGYGLGLKNMVVSIPGDETIRKISNVRDFRFNLCLDAFSKEAARTSLALMKKLFQQVNVPNQAKQQMLLIEAIACLSEILKTTPLITFSIDPFKHYFGEMKMKAEGRLYGHFPLFIPEAETVITFFKIDEILSKLRSVNLIAQTGVDEFREWLRQNALVKENGDTVITIIRKRDQPGKVFYQK